MWLLRFLPLLLTTASCTNENTKWSKSATADRRQSDWIPLTGPCINCQPELPQPEATSGLLTSHVDALNSPIVRQPTPIRLSPTNNFQGQQNGMLAPAHQIQPHNFLQLPRIYTQNQFLAQPISPQLINGQFLSGSQLAEQFYNQNEQYDGRVSLSEHSGNRDPQLSLGLNSDLRNAHRIIAALDSEENHGPIQNPGAKYEGQAYNSSIAHGIDKNKEEVQILYVPVETLKGRMRNSGAVKTDPVNYFERETAQRSREPVQKETKTFRHPIQPLKQDFQIGQARPDQFPSQAILQTPPNIKIDGTRPPNDMLYPPSADGAQVSPDNIRQTTVKNDNIQENSQRTYRAKQGDNQRFVNLPYTGVNPKPTFKSIEHDIEPKVQNNSEYDEKTSQQPPNKYSEIPQPTLPPNQPPLSVYLETTEKIGNVLNLLKRSKTIPVLDSIGPESPHVFVGPSNLNPPAMYLKFELPYLSSLHADQLTGRLDELPFFVAPLNFQPPPGYSKIPFPAPHIGSVLVSNSTTLREFQNKITESRVTHTTTPTILEPYDIPLGIAPLSPQLPSLINSLQVEKETTTSPSTTAAIATETYTTLNPKNSRRNHFRGSQRHTTPETTTTRRPQSRQRRPYSNRSYPNRKNAYPETSTPITQQPEFEEEYNVPLNLQNDSGINTEFQVNTEANKENVQNLGNKNLNSNDFQSQYKPSDRQRDFNQGIQYNRNEDFQLVPHNQNKFVNQIDLDSLNYERPNRPVNLKDIVIEVETTTGPSVELKTYRTTLKDFNEGRLTPPLRQTQESLFKQNDGNFERQHLFDNKPAQKNQANKNFDGQEGIHEGRLLQPNSGSISNAYSPLTGIHRIRPLIEDSTNDTLYIPDQNTRTYLPEEKVLNEAINPNKFLNEQISVQIPVHVGIQTSEVRKDDSDINQGHINSLQSKNRQQQFNQRQRTIPSSIQFNGGSTRDLVQTTEFENHAQRIVSDLSIGPTISTDFVTTASPTIKDDINDNLKMPNHRLRYRPRTRNNSLRNRNQDQSVYSWTEKQINIPEVYSPETVSEKSTTPQTFVRIRGRVRGRGRTQSRQQDPITEPPNYPSSPSTTLYKTSTEPPNYQQETSDSFHPGRILVPTVSESDNQPNKHFLETTTSIYDGHDEITATSLGPSHKAVDDLTVRKQQNRVRGHRRPLRPTTSTTTTTTTTQPPGTKYLIRTRRPSHTQTRIQAGRGRIRRPTTSTTTESPTTQYITQQKPNNLVNFAQISDFPAYKTPSPNSDRFDSSFRNNFSINYVSRTPPEAQLTLTPNDAQLPIPYASYNAHSSTTHGPVGSLRKNVYEHDNYNDFQNIRADAPLNLNYNSYDGSKQGRTKFQNDNEPVVKTDQKVATDYWDADVSIQQSKSYVFMPETTILTTQPTKIQGKIQSKAIPSSGVEDQHPYGDYDDYFSYQESSQYSTLDHSSVPSNDQYKPIIAQSQGVKNEKKSHPETTIIVPNVDTGRITQKSQLEREENVQINASQPEQPVIFLGHLNNYKGETDKINLTNFIETAREPAAIVNDTVLDLTESYETVSNKQTDTDFIGKKVIWNIDTD
ncbi:hypothetical protein AAG570_013200 [Ranatra chinensis]|uniref:Uncharacterized protein n=1 Tax=Ranatra chinensis TaxID=642074 RepID=A0ABD0YG73_9HEMI